jgi:hypothetical protein
MCMRICVCLSDDNLLEIVKKSHIGYEMALTSVYKQLVVLTLQAGFVRMS